MCVVDKNNCSQLDDTLWIADKVGQPVMTNAIKSLSEDP